eukprot:1505190-Amphidinium_carterae.1
MASHPRCEIYAGKKDLVGVVALAGKSLGVLMYVLLYGNFPYFAQELSALSREMSRLNEPNC